MAIAAAAGFYASTAVQAATVTLSGVTNNSCSYSGMSVQPDGSFSVTCAGVTSNPNPPPVSTDPGAVSLSNPGTAPVNSTVIMTIYRKNGSAGAASVYYNVAGAGCVATSGGVQWADQDAADKTFTVQTTGTLSSVCTINIGGNTGASIGSPAVIQFGLVAATNTGTPTPPPPVNTTSCPTGYVAPVDLSNLSLGGIGNPLIALAKSNQVVSMPLPGVQPGSSSGAVAFSESAGGAFTPQPVTLQISINKCPGLIDTDTNNRCNMTSTNGNYNSVTWFAKGYSVIDNQAQANLRGYCWAPADQGPWYVNAKWSYSQCAFGAQTCGFAVQQNYGPY